MSCRLLRELSYPVATSGVSGRCYTAGGHIHCTNQGLKKAHLSQRYWAPCLCTVSLSGVPTLSTTPYSYTSSTRELTASSGLASNLQAATGSVLPVPPNAGFRLGLRTVASLTRLGRPQHRELTASSGLSRVQSSGRYGVRPTSPALDMKPTQDLDWVQGQSPLSRVLGTVHCETWRRSPESPKSFPRGHCFAIPSLRGVKIVFFGLQSIDTF